MHRGVSAFIEWIETHKDCPDVRVHPPASSAQLGELERALSAPLPTDLRLVLGYFNGGSLPRGELLPAGRDPGSIGAELQAYAERVGLDVLDPDLIVPFYRTPEGSLLAFDRSAGPVADTWPIVDYDEESGDQQLVHRTFDGFCRRCVAEWSSPDFGAEFSLDTYLREGLRHANLEPDVASAHATVAHAQRRAGQPEAAMRSYLEAARCVPPLRRCDWEALKLAALLGLPAAALEAGTRLATPAPPAGWAARETTPGRVAEVIALVGAGARDRSAWCRLLELPILSAAPDERPRVEALLAALSVGAPAPTRLGAAPLPAEVDREALLPWAREAYLTGAVRDEDLLFDARFVALGDARREVLATRRDF